MDPFCESPIITGGICLVGIPVGYGIIGANIAENFGISRLVGTLSGAVIGQLSGAFVFQNELTHT